MWDATIGVSWQKGWSITHHGVVSQFAKASIVKQIAQAVVLDVFGNLSLMYVVLSPYESPWWVRKATIIHRSSRS